MSIEHGVMHRKISEIQNRLPKINKGQVVQIVVGVSLVAAGLELAISAPAGNSENVLTPTPAHSDCSSQWGTFVLAPWPDRTWGFENYDGRPGPVCELVSPENSR